MTPWEVSIVLEGQVESRSWVLETLAWVQANIMSMWSGKGNKIKANQLYRRGPEPLLFDTAEEFAEHMRKRREADEG